ncbi:hypothetical protein FOE78_08190 [Microlunatus elymi]|uniref:Uncharacterized protein n=1 Tax=Microlunatus elymi TaxID=2596828 RepID=A0A516PY36_9ACTN|nr:hypothetical protein [Microlunatus elymi]QDP95881.1 hypothetical protein FOE78_08190 [Microlunatus elymi]
MSAQELTFTAGGLKIIIGPGGLPVRVAVDGRDVLVGQDRPGAVTIDGRRRHWEFAGLVTDLDETEASYGVVDHPELAYTVRDGFTGSWLQRHMLLNTSSSTVTVDDLVLRLQPAADQIGWALIAAGHTRWSVQSADGRGPLLVGDLTQGVLAGQVEDGFRTGRLVLPPGRRLVLQWRIELVPEIARMTSWHGPTTSLRTELPRGEPYEIDDPDVAVLASDPVLVETEGDSQLVTSDQPGRYPVELRSARGTTRLDLAWVPPADELITELSSRWLAADRSAAGIGVMPGGGAALGLQQAVIGRLSDDQSDAEDAVALHTARLLDKDRLSIMDQAFLAQETVRTGDPEPLARARQAMLDIEEPLPGLGLAGTRLCLAELASGGDPGVLLARLHDVAGSVDIDDPTAAGEDHLRTVSAHLELITVTGPATGAGTTALLPYARSLGAELGSGLPGRRIGALRASTQLYAAAVLDLLPEEIGPALTSVWGISPHALAEQTRTSALAATLWPDDGGPDQSELSDAIGWLVLGGPIE